MAFDFAKSGRPQRAPSENDLGWKDGAQVELTGVVDGLRIVNPRNGWGFGQLYVKAPRTATVSFVGDIEEAYLGAEVKIVGVAKEHPKYGWQVAVSSLLVELATNVSGVAAWLAHRLPDIGPVLSSRIVNRWTPDELWAILEHSPEKLEEVEGIGPAIAHAAGEAYAFWKHEREQFSALSAYGLKPAQIREAVRTWGRDAAMVVSDDPYQLRHLRGVGFVSADAIARRMGLKRVDPRRIRAGLAEATRHSQREGHTCRTAKRLTSIAASPDILAIAPKFVMPEVEPAIVEQTLARGPYNGMIYAPEMCDSEIVLARGFARLLDPRAAFAAREKDAAVSRKLREMHAAAIASGEVDPNEPYFPFGPPVFTPVPEENES